MIDKEKIAELRREFNATPIVAEELPKNSVLNYVLRIEPLD